MNIPLGTCTPARPAIARPDGNFGLPLAGVDAHGFQQLVEGHRLHEQRDGTEGEGPSAVFRRRRATGEHDHRRVGGGPIEGADRLEHGKAVLPGKDQVEEHQGRR